MPKILSPLSSKIKIKYVKKNEQQKTKKVNERLEQIGQQNLSPYKNEF